MILIMSDTHFGREFSLSGTVLDHISECDLIIHSGDFVSMEFYDFLRSTGKLRAARGNNDYRLPDELRTVNIFEFSGLKFAVTHGHTVPNRDLHYNYPDADIIIFGHDHHPSVEHYGKKLILSPGSLTHNRRTDYNSFMILNIGEDHKPEVKIVKIH